MSLNINRKSFTPLLLSAFIIISPFLTVSFGKSPFEFPKFILTLIIAQILAFLLIFKKISFTKNKIVLLVSFFVLANFISDMFGLDPRISLLGGEYRFQGFLLLLSSFILFLSANQNNKKSIIYKSIILSSILLSTLAIAQFLMLRSGYFLSTYNGRVIATLGNPNFIGAYTAMALPFTLTIIKNKFLKLFLTAILILSVIISSSFSAILATSVILFIYIFKAFNKYNIKIQAISASLFLILIVTIILGLKDSIYRYSQWDNRFIIWNQGIKSVINKPFLGVGQENFELVVSRNMAYKVDNAHNIFMEVAVSGGLLGLLLYIVIIKKALKEASFAVKLAIIGFIIVGFFNPLPIICINVFWILLGLSSTNKKED